MPETVYVRKGRDEAAKKKAGTSRAFSDCLLRSLNMNNTYQIRQVQVCAPDGSHLASSAR
jgi:hypothetical protein